MTDDKTWLWVVVSSLMFLPMMLTKELKNLTYLSVFGFLTLSYIVLLVVLYSFDSTLYDLDRNLKSLKYFDVSQDF